MFSERTLVSASIPCGNYLQTLCLRCADHSKLRGVWVGLFPGGRRGEVAALFMVVWWCFRIQRFSHLMKFTFKYMHPLFFSDFNSSYFMGTWPWFADTFYFVIKVFSLTVFWGLALFLV